MDVNGINKMAGEWYHILYNNVYGIRACALRLTNTYGPRMRVQGRAPDLPGHLDPPAARGQAVRGVGGRPTSRFHLCGRRGRGAAAGGRIRPGERATCNLGGDCVISLRDLADLLLMIFPASTIGSKGLAAGGDDYLVKPFAFEEVMARLLALARRPTLGASQTKLAAGDLEMDLVARTVRRGGEAIDLQPREFRLLEYLMRAEGRLVTRKMLLEQVWEFNFDPKTNIVDNLHQPFADEDRSRPNPGPDPDRARRGICAACPGLASFARRVFVSPPSTHPRSRCRRWRSARSSTCPFVTKSSPISTNGSSRKPTCFSDFRRCRESKRLTEILEARCSKRGRADLRAVKPERQPAGRQSGRARRGRRRPARRLERAERGRGQ